MNENQIKPLSVKLTIELSISAYKKALAKSYNVDEKDIEIVIVNEPTKKEAMEKPVEKKEDPAPENRFLDDFMKKNGLSNTDVAQLCGVSEPTVKRMKSGYRVENPTFDKVVHGLELNAEQATALRNSLTRRQRGYTK